MAQKWYAIKTVGGNWSTVADSKRFQNNFYCAVQAGPFTTRDETREVVNLLNKDTNSPLIHKLITNDVKFDRLWAMG